jgi:phosphatidylethanolamine/phosphatidyl-N-methylethanolamine N-methyltransferase
MKPGQIGALAPSSMALARFMARQALSLCPKDAMILDLGAGTGRFSRALLEAGLAPSRLVLVELDPLLVAYLRQQFPQALVIQGNACFLDQILPSETLKTVGVVVSGLPMLNFPPVVQEKIIHACDKILRSDGAILQFTYGPCSSIPASSLSLSKKRLGCVWVNFPPAYVWMYRFLRHVDGLAAQA